LNKYLKEAKEKNQAKIQKNDLDRKKSKLKSPDVVSGANCAGCEPCSQGRTDNKGEQSVL